MIKIHLHCHNGLEDETWAYCRSVMGMSERRQEELFDLSASYQFVVDRVREAGGRSLGCCSACGHSNWVAEAVYKGDGEVGDLHHTRASAYLYKSSFSFWSMSPSIPLLALTCANCGNVRIHNLAWIKKQMGDEQTDE